MSSKKINVADRFKLFKGKSFLSIIILLVIYLVVSQLYMFFNTEKATMESDALIYDTENNCYILDYKLNHQYQFFLDDNLLFFPNVSARNISGKYFTDENYELYPHATGISISSTSGWNDLGSNAQWYYSNGHPIYQTFTDRNGISYVAGTYMIRIKGLEGIHSINISIPKISGSATVFCNGAQVGSISKTSDKISFPNYPQSFENITVETDVRGNAVILIAVESDPDSATPGMLSLPSINNHKYNLTGIIVSSIWIAIICFSIIISIIGGAIVSRTFTGKGKFYALLFTELALMVYTMVDSNVLYIVSPIKEYLKYALIIILGIITYSINESFFRKTEEIKTFKYFRHDFIFNAICGVLLVIILLINPDWLYTDYPYVSTVCFTLVGTVISIAKILVFYLKEKYAVIAINIYLTVFFCFTFMFYNDIPKIEIKPYTLFFVIGLFALEFYFILRYVQQYYELRNSSDKLQYLVKEKTLHISEINRDLYNTNKRLLENEEARKNVLSNVSHDLRTPITAIRGYAELLISSGKNMKEEQKELYLQNIIKRAVQMERIVSDIVELTRMESNKDEFKFNDIALAEMLDEIYMMYEGEVRGTGKRITLDLPSDDLLIIKADFKKLSRVFENLISNAINYTYDEALIEIKAWREGIELPLNDQRIHITIKDNGIGIPAEEVEHVFDRFYRAKNSGKNIKGTGLGLSIVSTIIKHHDADISVESQLGSGTTFHIVMKATY